MKRILFAAAAALCLAACGPKGPAEPTIFTVTPDKDKEINAEAQELRYTVNCDQSLTAETSEKWAEVKSVQDRGDNKYYVNVAFTFNESEEDRECVIAFKSGSQTLERKVTQKGWCALFDATSLTFEGMDDSKKLKITTAQSGWTLELTDTKAAPGWISADKTSGPKGAATEIEFKTTAENLTMEDRSCFAKFTVSGKNFYVTLTQKPTAHVIVDGRKKEVGYEGGDLLIKVGSNFSYASTIDVDWIDPVEVKGAEIPLEDRHFTVKENPDIEPRTGHIVFSCGAASETVTIYQVNADRIILGVDKLIFPAYGGTKRVDLRSNIEYQISCNEAGWISAAKAANLVDAIDVSVEANASATPRTAVVTVSGIGNGGVTVSGKLEIEQLGTNAESPFENTEIGVFGYNAAGDDFVADKFEYQFGCSANWFRIIDANADKFLEVGEIPGTLNVGDSFRARVVQNFLPDVPANALHTMTVYKKSGNLVWLTDESATGYTIKR